MNRFDEDPPKPTSGFIRAHDGGRPTAHPDFKERIKGGADPKKVLAEAEKYHGDRGSLDEYRQSNTYAWIKERAQ